MSHTFLNDEIGMLMHDFSCSDFRDMYIVEMRESVKRAKTIEMEESDMCEVLEQFRDKAIAEGEAKVKLEEKVSVAKNLKEMDSEDTFIAKALNCNVDYVKELLALN